MIKLFFRSGTAAMAPHVLLHELGLAHELVLVDQASDAQHQPDYLRLNPNGLLPTLTDGDLVLYESAAICLYLCDQYPAAGLAPAVGTVARAHFYKWLCWMTNTLQASLLLYWYPERWVNEGNASGAVEVKAHAEAKVGGLLDQLEQELAHHGGPWLLGQDYSALDPFCMMLCRWTRGFDAPARNRPLLGRYLKALLARPAVQKMLAAEQLQAPYV